MVESIARPEHVLGAGLQRRKIFFAEKRRLSGTKIDSRIDPKSAEFEKNTRLMIERVAEIKTDEETISQGGGAKAIEAQHKKGRLTARERIAKLIDSKTKFFELSAFAAYGMYEEWGGA